MVSLLFKWLLIFTVSNFQPVSNSPFRGLGGHPIFVSVTEIEHNAKDKTLEISCKIFTDDFEKALRETYAQLTEPRGHPADKTHVDLLQPKDKTAMNKLVSDYVQKHLQLKVDDKPVTLQFIGYEQQEEGIVSFYQVNNIAAVKKLDITNNILFEYKKEQMNILHVTVNGQRQSTKLINPEEKAGFVF